MSRQERKDRVVKDNLIAMEKAVNARPWKKDFSAQLPDGSVVHGKMCFVCSADEHKVLFGKFSKAADATDENGGEILDSIWMMESDAGLLVLYEGICITPWENIPTFGVWGVYDADGSPLHNI